MSKLLLCTWKAEAGVSVLDIPAAVILGRFVHARKRRAASRPIALLRRASSPGVHFPKTMSLHGLWKPYCSLDRSIGMNPEIGW